MKPKYIFFAVAAMCVLMLAVLPQLGAPRSASAAAESHASTAQDFGPAAAANIAAAGDAALPIAPTLVPDAPEPTLPPVVVEQEAAAEPAVAEPAAPPARGGDLPVFNPPPASAPPAEAAPPILPEVQAFAASLVNGQAETLVGFYAPGVLALPVLQQPTGDDNFISDQDGTVTQFNRPSEYGALGLLAHNTLSGRLFFRLRNGGEIYLIYGDGRVAGYRVSGIQSYQALSPYDTHSDFVDLNTPEAPVLSHRDLFERVYTTPGRLVLQTCIEANGETTWGRLFVVADPI